MTIAERPLARKLDSYLQTLAAEEQFSGVVLCASGDEIVLKRGYGLAERESGLVNSPETVFPIASLSKAFTAFAILLLVAQKQIDLNERVRFYLPECPIQWETITIHHLLTHSSGIPNHSNIPNLNIAEILPTSPWTLLNLVASLPLDFASGSQFAYSNTGYHLLGALIERIAAQPLAHFFAHQLFRPLGMAHTSCALTEIDAPVARGYLKTDETITPAQFLDLSLCPAAGGICSTAGDLYRWSQSLRSQQLLPVELLKLMELPHLVITDQSEHYGYGWAIREEFGSKLTYHMGGLPGYRHCLGYLHEQRMTTILLGNYDWITPCLLTQKLSSLIFEEDESV